MMLGRVRSSFPRVILTLLGASGAIDVEFIDSYLKLSVQELKEYEREFAALEPEERQTTMALVSSWEQRGIERGIERGIDQGKGELIVLLVQDRFGTVPAELLARLSQLSSEQFNVLGRALLHFDTLADLEGWLSLH